MPPVTDPNAKPYKFVSLPRNGKQTSNQIHGHEKWSGLSGILTCTIKAVTPLHVASGMVVTTSELKTYTDINWPPNFSEPLVLEHFRSNGKRIIPATSLKGSIRSIVEAISQSCVSKAKGVKEDRSQNPNHRSPFNRSKECFVRSGQALQLCPACRLFGAMGFEGKVRVSDAQLVSGDGAIAFRPAPNQPNRNFSRDHPIHDDKYYKGTNDGWQIKGRKFYLHFGQPQDQRIKYEPIEVCDKNSIFSLHIDFECLKDEELGLLLVALGQNNGVPVFKLGGSKPFGYGSIEVSQCMGQVWDTQSSRMRCLDWDESVVAPKDWVAISDSVTKKAHESGLVLTQQFAELKAIYSSTPSYSSEDISHWQKGADRYE